MSEKKTSTRKIVGAIFPISYPHFIRLLKGNKKTFVKFTKFKHLKKGSKIIFYISGYKLLFGEGTIADIEVLDVETAWRLYSQRIFLTKEEYDNYTRHTRHTRYTRYTRKSSTANENRRARYITLFSLKNLKEFRIPTKTSKPVTPAGYYITK